MAIESAKRATINDLYAVEGQAELIGGRIVQSLSGDFPTDIALNIYISLRVHSKTNKRCAAKGSGIGYTVPELPSGRESFSPDASYYDGPLPRNRMRFIEGPPTFGAEVRSENDYGPAAELAMADKRDDYFAAGTLVVWDVDPIAETIASYRHDARDKPTIFRRGEIADAEPAVPGWRIAVNEVFDV